MKLGTFTGAILVIGASTQTASADNVLVFGDHAGGTRIAAVLAAEGHTTTVMDTMPGRPYGYDAIWHVGATVPLTPGEQQVLAGFVNDGGGVYLTGDGPGAEAMNDSVQGIANATVYKGGISLSEESPTVSGTHRFFASARGFVAAHPNDLYVWEPTVSGSIIGPVGENVLTIAPDGRVTSAAWAGPEMMNGRGQLLVMMDSGWVSSPYSIKRIVQNIERFLIDGVPATCGNLVAEEGETCDDGNFDDGDDCLTSCDVATCGDGFRMQGAEQCDDANATSGDGCSSTCGLEISPSDETNDNGDDPLETDGVAVPDDTDPELDDDLAAGCSAGGGPAGGGALVLAAFAMLGLTRRRRTA